MRKALSMVIDREILSKRVTADGQPPAYSLIVAGVVGADPTPYEWATWPMEKRVAEAKKLLEQAGVKPGTKYSFSTTPANTTRRWRCLWPRSGRPSWASSWKPRPWSSRCWPRSATMALSRLARNGWLADYNDATTFLALVRCDSDQNTNFYCDREAEALIQKGNQSTDAAKRKDIADPGLQDDHG